MKAYYKRSFFIIFIIFSAIGVFLTVAFGINLYKNHSICSHPSYSKTIIEPSCTSEGKTINRCNECSYEYISDVRSASEHIFSSSVIPPSCNTQGYTLNYCSCGYSYASSITSPLSHSLLCAITEPTCTEEGYSMYKCTLCEYSFKSDFSPPIGHKFSSEVFLPTATQAGYTEYTCECSYKYIGNHIFYSDILENAYTENTSVLAKGIDVSRWNHQIDTATGEYLPIDWAKVKASGFDFAIIKAGSTKSGIEPTFEMDYSGAKEAGLEVGAYFYTYSNNVTDIVKDAQNLMLWLADKKFEYPIYLDLEDPSLMSLGKNHLGNMCTAFLEELQKNGYYTGLYTNHTWLTTILDTPKIVSFFDIWYARYPGTAAPAWNEEKYGRQLGMWQYTQSGSIYGIEGDFDFNYAYKDYSEIMKKWGLNGYSRN